jgi:hypothetical protein
MIMNSFAANLSKNPRRPQSERATYNFDIDVAGANDQILNFYEVFRS